jgi:hypothetical protein
MIKYSEKKTGALSHHNYQNEGFLTIFRLSDVFLGDQLCQYGVGSQHFGDSLLSPSSGIDIVTVFITLTPDDRDSHQNVTC